MPTPSPDPAVAPSASPLAQQLAAQNYRVAFTTDGGEPSLAVRDGRLRGYAVTGRTADAAAIELWLGDARERRPFLVDRLAVAAGSAVRIVPLYAQGPREWFAVIEVPPAGDASAAWRVRLLERRDGRGEPLASHDSHAHASTTQIRYPYALAGEAAVVKLGASLYAVVGGRLLVLDGPGADAPRFAETSDPDCPPGKRCYPLPAEIDVKRLVGAAPDGRSFVMAGEGRVVRRDVATGATVAFGYENFFYTGLVEDDALVLAHAGEPPFVKRWTPASSGPPSPGPPLPSGVRAAPTPPEEGIGDARLLVAGPIYVQLARARDGALYGVSGDGSLDRIADGRATPVVRLPAGHRVVAVAAADALAFVVASDATPPVHSVVVGSPPA